MAMLVGFLYRSTRFHETGNAIDIYIKNGVIYMAERNISASEKRICDCLKSDRELTMAQLSRRMNVSRHVIEQLLGGLVESGYVKLRRRGKLPCSIRLAEEPLPSRQSMSTVPEKAEIRRQRAIDDGMLVLIPIMRAMIDLARSELRYEPVRGIRSADETGDATSGVRSPDDSQ